MVSGGCEQELQLACTCPQFRFHRDRCECVESRCDLTRAGLVRREASELQAADVADEYSAGRDLGVEPGGKLGEAPISGPRPHAGVKQGGTIEWGGSISDVGLIEPLASSRGDLGGRPIDVPDDVEAGERATSGNLT